MEGMRFYSLLAVVAVVWLTGVSMTGDTDRCRLNKAADTNADEDEDETKTSPSAGLHPLTGCIIHKTSPESPFPSTGPAFHLSLPAVLMCHYRSGT